MPLTQILTDNAKSFDLSFNLGDNGEGKLDVSGTFDEKTLDGRLEMKDYLHDTLTATLNVQRKTENGMLTSSLDYGNNASQKAEVRISRSTNPMNPAFDLDAVFTPGPSGLTRSINVKYDGKKLGGEGEAIQGGDIEFALNMGNNSYAVKGIAVLMVNGMRASEWMIDTSKVTPIASASREDAYQLELDINAVVGNALGKLQEAVPGINQLLAGLANAM